jgi:hypothetical protein
MAITSQNNRVYYAVHAVGFAQLGSSGFKPASGVQSAGMNTSFSLDQVLQLGQLELYDLIENIPSVELTVEKVLDGAPLLQHLATQTATSSSLSGRFNNQRAMVAISYYDDENSAASGTPLSTVLGSGMYISSVQFNFPVDGNFVETVTLVGNDKTWATGTMIGSGQFAFVPTTYTNTSVPPFGTVLRRQHMVMSGCRWPTEIPGISSSGTNDIRSDGAHGVHMQSVNVSVDLGRTELFELGKRGPYHRFVDFPTEVTTAIEVIETEYGDLINARSESTNIVNQTIYIQSSDNTRINLGTKNKLSSVSSTGGDTGGGNRTSTYTYTNFNSLAVLHPQDPAAVTSFV